MKVSMLKDSEPLIIQYILGFLLPLGYLIGLRFIQMSSKNSSGQVISLFPTIYSVLKNIYAMSHLNDFTYHWHSAENQVCAKIPRGRMLKQIQMEYVTASNSTTQRQGSVGYGIHRN